jgi:hypothetical protein
MRRTRTRFKIRLLMILVAVVALLLAGGIGAVGLVRRARHFSQMAAYHASQERFVLGKLPVMESALASSKQWAEVFARSLERMRYRSRSSRHFPDGPSGLEDTTRRLFEEFERSIQSVARSIQFTRGLASFHARMKQKYERAASRPWRSVPPDPPPPTMPPEPPEPPAQPDTSPRNPERRIEPRPFLTLAPGKASRAGFPS